MGTVTTEKPSCADKQCTKCGKQKPLEHYHKNKNGILGRESHCKSCVRAAKKEKRKKKKKLLNSASGFTSFLTGELGIEAQRQFGDIIGSCIQGLMENGKI